jgi:hypothetical protein
MKLMAEFMRVFARVELRKESAGFVYIAAVTKG